MFVLVGINAMLCHGILKSAIMRSIRRIEADPTTPNLASAKSSCASRSNCRPTCDRIAAWKMEPFPTIFTFHGVAR